MTESERQDLRRNDRAAKFMIATMLVLQFAILGALIWL